MAKRIRVSLSDCSYSELCRAAQKSGFETFEGRKHCKVKTVDGTFVTLIPRHARLKRETAKGIVDALNAAGAAIAYS